MGCKGLSCFGLQLETCLFLFLKFFMCMLVFSGFSSFLLWPKNVQDWCKWFLTSCVAL